MATSNTTQIIPPRVPIADNLTGVVSREWYRWFYNIYNITGGGNGVTPVENGGTGLSTIPTNGQLLIGNGSGYTLNTLGYGAGITVTNGAGIITVSNAGVLSWSGGTTGLAPVTGAIGDVVLSGTLLAKNGGTGYATYAVGDLLYADTTTTLEKLPDVATGNALISGGVNVAPSWGKIGLTTHVSGVLPIANGGTNSTATPTSYGVAYGTGSAYAFTAAGTTKQVLRATTGSAPTWTTLTTGTSILYGDGSGGFSNATISAPLAYSAGTLSITQSGTASNGYLSSTDWNTFNNKQAAGVYVTSISVVSANGFAGTVTSGATPAITLTTSITGLLKGNGTAISAATAGTDYLVPSAPVTYTANFSVATTDVWIINNKSGSSCTATLPTASSYTGRILRFQNYQAQTLISASSNVVPLVGGAAGTAILAAVAGDTCTLVSDGSNWLMTQYTPNNVLLLE